MRLHSQGPKSKICVLSLSFSLRLAILLHSVLVGEEHPIDKSSKAASVCGGALGLWLAPHPKPPWGLGFNPATPLNLLVWTPG